LGCWLGTSSSAGWLAVEVDVDVEAIVLAAAVLNWVSGATYVAALDISLLSRDIVGAPAVLPLDNGEGKIALDLGVTMVGAVSVGHVLPGIIGTVCGRVL